MLTRTLRACDCTMTNKQNKGVAEWGVTPRYSWVRDGLGGKHGFESASNIVFSNGRLDPWHGGGVLKSESHR